MKVFLTGNLGYIGNVLSEMLLNSGFNVTGYDNAWYPQDFIPKNTLVENQIIKDIRDITFNDLLDFDSVIHLAGMSNDPLGELNPELTKSINHLATVNLAKKSKEAGVKRFIFSSSCSNYGANAELVNENSQLAPQTAYAKSKVDSEKEILKLADDNFSPIILRNATVYGISPSLRMDLSVNNLTGSAVATGIVKLLSDGTAWRPLIHVRDVSNAFVEMIKADLKDVHGKIFNVGSNDENYTIRQVAEIVKNIVPNSKVEFADGVSKDARSYKVDFSRIHNDIGFQTKWTVEDGVKEIHKCLINKKPFSESNFTDKKLYRLKFLKWLIDNNKIDKNLRSLDNKHNY